ncbi:MAG: hypothetical protein R2746_10435 [Acidimicrobiales bacterium]
MPDDDITAIAYLRKQLDTATDPLHRHFAFNELERRLYKCRHAFASALTESDHTCESHDSEMTTIRPALVDAGAVLFLPTLPAGEHPAPQRQGPAGGCSLDRARDRRLR